MLSSNNVLICDAEKNVVEIVDVSEAGDDIQRFRGVLSPGFINCHCHLELSHMRGLIPEKTGLIDFVFAVVSGRNIEENKVLQAIAEAEDEMIQNGIVAVGDICNNELTAKQKIKQNLHYYNFIEVTGWLPEMAAQRFKKSLTFFDEFTKVAPTSMVPHAPYSVSESLWRLITPYFENKVVSIHNQETVFEDELFVQNSGDFRRMYEMMNLDTSFFTPSGKSSLQTYLKKLSGAKHLLLVHNTFTQQKDVEFALQNRQPGFLSFCLCINANQYIEDAVPPVETLRGNNCNIVLGTDSLASNHSLSIVDEIKTIQKFFPGLSISEMLGWATLNGAKALLMDDLLGSFEKGKQPGVVLLKDVDVAETATVQSAKVVKLL